MTNTESSVVPSRTKEDPTASDGSVLGFEPNEGGSDVLSVRLFCETISEQWLSRQITDFFEPLADRAPVRAGARKSPISEEPVYPVLLLVGRIDDCRMVAACVDMARPTRIFQVRTVIAINRPQVVIDRVTV